MRLVGTSLGQAGLIKVIYLCPNNCGTLLWRCHLEGALSSPLRSAQPSWTSCNTQETNKDVEGGRASARSPDAGDCDAVWGAGLVPGWQALEVVPAFIYSLSHSADVYA